MSVKNHSHLQFLMMYHITRIIVAIIPFFLIPVTSQNVGEPIVHFSGPNNGANPQSTLTEVNYTGVLYGVTRYGGNSSDDLGVIYRINTTSNNTFAVIYQFTRDTGCQPISSLVFDGGHLLFGSTIRCSQYGYGNLFRFDLTNHKFEIIYEFQDTANPDRLFLDKSTQLLYGTAGVGSATFAGSVFTIDIQHPTPSSTFKQLFSFNYATGSYPSSLILVNNSLYINTEIFGEFGGGTLVKMDRDGKNAQLVYAFGGDKALGCCPWGKLVLVTDQRDQYLYGTTMGAADCPSTIYRVKLTSMTNQIELVQTFNSSAIGTAPFDGLIPNSNSSSLYGVTSSGGLHNRGTMFRFDTTDGGKLDKLFDFPSNDTFGYETIGGLLEVGHNVFYGAAYFGGNYGNGTVYKISIS